MKLAFRFENGTSQLILSPETQRDKTYLGLCVDGRADIKLKPTSSDDIIIEFTESKPKSVEPTIYDKVNAIQVSMEEAVNVGAIEQEKF